MIEILCDISSFSILIPFILTCRYFYKLTSFSLLIVIYILTGVLFEIINIWRIIALRQNTITSTNVFALIEISIILSLFYNWTTERKLKNIYLIFLAVYTSLWSLSIIKTGINELNSILSGSGALLVISASLLFLGYAYMKNYSPTPKWQIIISIAFFFYFIINAGIFSFTEYFLQFDEQVNWIYFSVIHCIGNVGLNVILALGLYQCSKQL